MQDRDLFEGAICEVRSERCWSSMLCLVDEKYVYLAFKCGHDDKICSARIRFGGECASL